MIQHFLEFVTSGHGMLEINEPVGFDALDFGIEQESDRIAVDSSYAGANSKIMFTSHAHQLAFPIIMYNLEFYGYEAVIKYIIKFDDVEEIIGQLNLIDRVTDKKTMFEVSIREESYKNKLKFREDISTNLLSDKTLDDEDINPCQLTNVLIKAKPITNVSKWETTDGGGQSVSVAGLGGTGNNIRRNFGFANVNTQWDIENSLSFIQGDQDANFFGYIQALDNLKNIVIDITNVTFSATGTNYAGLGGSAWLRLFWFVGEDSELTNSTFGTTLEYMSIIDDESKSVTNKSYRIEIPYIERNKKIYIWFSTFTSSEDNFSTFGLVTNVESMNVQIKATSIAYNTIAPCIKLYDAIAYNIKSSSNLNSELPRWREGGEFNEQYITTTPLMRNLIDKPFNLSFKEITDDYFPEIYGDFVIKPDGTVFIGRYPDFYKDNELLAVDLMPYEGYSNEVNPRYAIIKFNYGYDSYASQKENDDDNTYDIVHGQKQSMLRLNETNNTKDVKVGFVRDAFFIELQRRKASNISDDTATQDDGKKYLLDVIELRTVDRIFTETSMLQHQEVNDFLVLKNDGTFSFNLIGITPFTDFTIHNGDNAGGYIVIDVTERSLTLQKITPISPIVNYDEFNTNYTYYIAPIAASHTVRTNEGFTLISNILDPDDFANLRFSVARNERKYYSEYLATANMYSLGKAIKKTDYINNPEAQTQLTLEEIITEGEDWTPLGAILTPEIEKISVPMSLTTFLSLRDNIRNTGGFIRYFDTNGLPVKGYIQKAVFTVNNSGRHDMSDYVGTLAATVEVKHQPYYIEIFKSPETGLIVNSVEYSSNFSYRMDDFGKLYLYDGTGKLIYVPVRFDKVKVNNSETASTQLELAQWLNAII